MASRGKGHYINARPMYFARNKKVSNLIAVNSSRWSGSPTNLTGAPSCFPMKERSCCPTHAFPACACRPRLFFGSVFFRHTIYCFRLLGLYVCHAGPILRAVGVCRLPLTSKIVKYRLSLTSEIINYTISATVSLQPRKKLCTSNGQKDRNILDYRIQ